jgi:hypothetical protein
MTGLVYPHHLIYITTLSLAAEDAILQNRIKGGGGPTEPLIIRKNSLWRHAQ